MKIDISSKNHPNTFCLVDDDAPQEVFNGKWTCNKVGYVVRQIKTDHDCKLVYMHRLISGATQGEICDHKNGNRLDNRRENLRVCTSSQNNQNRVVIGGARKQSIYKGVCKYPFGKTDMWRAYIRVPSGSGRGVQKNLGVFSSEKEAAKAYNNAALDFFGEYAQINKI